MSLCHTVTTIIIGHLLLGALIALVLLAGCGLDLGKPQNSEEVLAKFATLLL